MYDPASALTGTEAVFAAHPDHAAVKALSSLATDAKYDRAELTITVTRENVIAACQALQQAGYNFLETVPQSTGTPPNLAFTSPTTSSRIR
jgi:NADH-quinone oxidoreductase subunit C